MVCGRIPFVAAFLFVIDKSVGSLTVQLPGAAMAPCPNWPRYGADPALRWRTDVPDPGAAPPIGHDGTPVHLPVY